MLSKGVMASVLVAALLVHARSVYADPADAVAPEGIAAGAPVSPQAASPSGRDDPYPRRPQCASMFLKADWQLSSKQRACDWINNRVFSTTALAAAAWSAGYSKVTDRDSEQGDGFATRFGRKFMQGAFKSTGSYLGGMVFREDPRTRPPYLVMKQTERPHGFFARTTHALGRNLLSYRCVADCTMAEHIRRVPAVSRVAGSLASGASSELWESSGHPSGNRALRGAASAYASTFVDAVFTEFRPELNAIAGKALRVVLGGR